MGEGQGQRQTQTPSSSEKREYKALWKEQSPKKNIFIFVQRLKWAKPEL